MGSWTLLKNNLLTAGNFAKTYKTIETYKAVLSLCLVHQYKIHICYKEDHN